MKNILMEVAILMICLKQAALLLVTVRTATWQRKKYLSSHCHFVTSYQNIIVINYSLVLLLKQVDQCTNLADFGSSHLKANYSFSNFSFKVSLTLPKCFLSYVDDTKIFKHFFLILWSESVAVGFHQL